MPLVEKLQQSLHRRDGPLTRDLVQIPGKFGLGKVPAGTAPDDMTSMVCGFCSVGCSLNVHLRRGQAINLTPNPEYPVNLGMACPKGWEALTPLFAPDRATVPLLRNANGTLEPVDWDTAMQVFTVRFKAIQDQHGPEAVAWLGTGQIVTEELAFLGALAKFGMGMVHGDGNTRQCMATTVAAYKQSFGFDAPPYTYRDLEESDVLVFIGSNVCIAHPILWQRVLGNRHRPEIIVIDPRKTETAMAATQHYAIQPKSDLVLFYGLARLLIEHGWIDASYIERHTAGFEEFRAHVAQFPPEKVERATGLSTRDLHRLANTIHAGKRVSFWWTMGVNQGHDATRTAQAIINVALLTGNIGRPGTGANSITGQCNAMGSRLFSNTTNLLGGHDFANPGHREKVARILGTPPALIPRHSGWAYDQILEGIDGGKIRGLWIVATNSAHSWVHQDQCRRMLRKLDFLVVQDMYANTETAQHAHLLLPAGGWGEKEGTFINSERRIGLVKKVSRSPGKALSDFNIFKLVAHYWGCGGLFASWTSPEAVFQILKRLSAGQPCDFTGIKDYRMIDDAGGIQWPFPEALIQRHLPHGQSQRERRLFEEGRFFHSDGKARFVFGAPRELPEAPDDAFPFLLLTGRGSSAQWHTGTRTARSDVLRKLHPPFLYVEMHPADAARLGIRQNETVKVFSRRSEVEATVVITAGIPAGQLFIPMHYEAANRLTAAIFDPHSRQPAYKSCAVAVRRVAC